MSEDGRKLVLSLVLQVRLGVSIEKAKELLVCLVRCLLVEAVMYSPNLGMRVTATPVSVPLDTKPQP